MRNTFRHGDTMIAVESQPATIAFDDLLAATRVIDDTDNGEAPWENWDGWEHTAKPPHAFDHADVREMQGYCPHMGQGRALRYHLARRGYRWGLPLRPRARRFPPSGRRSACRCPPANHRAACQMV